jgi:hypothetical protein
MKNIYALSAYPHDADNKMMAEALLAKVKKHHPSEKAQSAEGVGESRNHPYTEDEFVNRLLAEN